MVGDDVATPARDRTSAFHDLGLRLVSGLALGAVVIGTVAVGGAWYGAMTALAALALIFEWNRLVGAGGMSWSAGCHAAAVLGALGLAFAGAYGFGLGILVAGMVGALFLTRGDRWAGLGPFYIGLPVLALTWLRLAPHGEMLVYWLLISIWAMDTGAYVAGRLIGGPKLAPCLSPKKTWSGALGGVVAAVACGSLVAWIAGLPGVATFGLASGLLGAWSQVGDICESAMKRCFGVKDTSGFIPGHGGFMDRLDGLLFAAPLAAFAIAAGVIG